MAFTSDPSGRVATVTYSPDDDVIGAASPSGKTVRYQYDARRQLASVVYPSGSVIQLAYDNRKNLTAVTDERGFTRTFNYDELYRIVGRRDPLGSFSTAVYDAVGNVLTTTDRLGRRTTMTYDQANRLIRATYSDAVVNYGYDSASRLIHTDDSAPGAGGIDWTYDGADRIVSETTPAGAVSYTYNSAGQRTSMTVADRLPVRYAYDNGGRLQAISQGSETFNYAYDTLSRRTGIQRPNQVSTTFRYDGVDRLTEITHANPLGIIEDLRYSYDLDDEIVGISSLASASLLPQGLTVSPADPANRLTATGGTTFQFDALGQTLSKTDGQGTTAYQWDARGRLSQVTLPSGQLVTHAYDAVGRRVRRAAGAATTSFLYDGAQVVLDRGSDGSNTDYLCGPEADELLRESHAGSGPLYSVRDHHTSTVAITDSNGGVVEREQYAPFGATPGSSLTRYGFTGRELDASTGLMYYRSRWYDPQQGRFIREDPAGYEAGLNLYKYADDSPVRFSDPFGLQTYGSAVRYFTPKGEFDNYLPVDMIKDIIDGMVKNCDCIKAFAALGLDLEGIIGRGFVLARGSVLLDGNISNEQIGITASARSAGKHLIEATGARGATLNPPSSGWVQGKRRDFLPRVYLRDIKSRCSITETLAHELVHVGGKPGTDPGWWRKLWHPEDWTDLDYLGAKYFNIIEACGCK
jgi:RHS repeat-associated protein